jgi:hypothetical protein
MQHSSMKTALGGEKLNGICYGRNLGALTKPRDKSAKLALARLRQR